MPLYMNMFWVEDGAHHKPSIGVADMTRAYSEANGILANMQAKAGEQRPKLIIPWASQPYTLKYNADFGSPFRWRDTDRQKDDALKSKVIQDLRADNAGYIAKMGLSVQFINVFFVWSLQPDKDGNTTYGITLSATTVVIASSKYMGQALAHEIGHALIGSSSLNEHPVADGTLMTKYVDGVGPKLAPGHLGKMNNEATRRMTPGETAQWSLETVAPPR